MIKWIYLGRFRARWASSRNLHKCSSCKKVIEPRTLALFEASECRSGWKHYWYHSECVPDDYDIHTINRELGS